MPAQPKRAMEFLTNAMDKLEALGGDYLCGCIAYALGLFTGAPPTDAERQTVIEVLGEVAADAKKRGITLGLEVVNRHEGYVFTSLADARAAIKAIGADNIQLHADTYHMNIEEADFMQPVLACGSRLGYVHIGESNRGYLGSGTVDFAQFFKALTLIGYQGVITFESFSSTVVNEDLSNALAIWRNLWDDGMNLATHARQYMANSLQAAAMARSHC